MKFYANLHTPHGLDSTQFNSFSDACDFVRSNFPNAKKVDASMRRLTPEGNYQLVASVTEVDDRGRMVQTFCNFFIEKTPKPC